MLRLVTTLSSKSIRYKSFELFFWPIKAILLPLGCHEVVNTPSKPIGIFLYLPFLTFTIIIESSSPLFDANAICFPFGDHDNPGCNHFNSSKSGELFPRINLFFCFPELTFKSTKSIYPD